MTHYYCPGSCAGVSDKPGVCQAENCEKHNVPLLSCECADGQHNRTDNADKKEEKSESGDA